MDAQIPDDGLKWFGEGFDGFPRRLSDDCVEYIIHVIDEKLKSPSAVRARLSEVLRAANDLKKKHLKDYIWQRQHFELNLVPKLDLARTDLSGASKATPFLKGRTDFGDSVADEWLIVYLLRELSSQFPDAWIRVYDTDGEFLLIEAANTLPKWLNPDIAENRVWLNAGHLKIIALESGSSSHNLTLQSALNFIRISPDRLLIESAVEKEAFHRLREYPSVISSSLHNALITIPRRLAYLLHRNPSYISPAIEAFYLRDPVSLKSLNTKDTATLVFAPEDFVTVSVKFTKVGFAQLRSQIFDAPPAWTGIIPRLQDDKAMMGMKLACGFEILLSDPQNQDKREVREMKLLLEDIEGGEEVLPDDAEISSWPKTEDDEKWLDIDYNDFEKELSGKPGSGEQATKEGFGDKGAQENLRKMVSRFEDFLKDDEAGVDGIDDISETEHEQSDDEPEDDTKEVSDVDDLEFQDAMRETQAMPKEQLEENGLLEEARKLALQDAEDASDLDEDEEMRNVIQAMEEELKGHGALDLSNGRIKKVKNKDKGKGKGKASKEPTTATDRPFFGPPRPSNMATKKNVSFADDDVEEIGPGEEELSSDEEDYNDVDLGLAKNMLESFKGQAGMSGPAGNLMRSLGVNMPRDEDSD